MNLTDILNSDSNTTINYSAAFYKILFEGPEYGFVFFSLGIICLLLSIWAVWSIWERNGSPTKYSLTNLLLSEICALSSPFIKALKKNKIFVPDSPFLCSSLGFYGRFSLAFLPITMMSLFYETIHPKSVAQNKTLSLRNFIFSWIVTIFLSIPGLETNRYQNGRLQHPLKCWKTYILDSKSVHVVYELLFTLTVSLVPSIYMMYALYHMKFKAELLFLFKKIPEGLKENVCKIRWAVAYTAFFNLFWLLPGPILLGLKLQKYWNEEQIEGHFRPGVGQEFPLARAYYMTQLALNPVIFILAHYHFGFHGMIKRVTTFFSYLCTRGEFIKRMRQGKKVPEITSTLMKMETFSVES